MGRLGLGIVRKTNDSNSVYHYSAAFRHTVDQGVLRGVIHGRCGIAPHSYDPAAPRRKPLQALARITGPMAADGPDLGMRHAWVGP